ncbi:MAG TPA: hypothetical protein DD379_08035 [Cyanobacteria bacterium UBA11162]|nr:hypothetical protein [Cyanobacteria bacterium UBA11162]
MNYKDVDGQSARLMNFQLAAILSGFKAVLTQCDAANTTKIELTFIDQQLAQEGSISLPEGCKYKCWYNQSANSTQCGVVCNLAA